MCVIKTLAVAVPIALVIVIIIEVAFSLWRKMEKRSR